jgi:starch synthase (maltosyl-transferring)
MESVARPGSEENLDNEKYEFKFRDWVAEEKAGRSIAPWLGQLNGMREHHPALRQLRNLDVHWTDDDAILAYTKHLPARFNGGTADSIIVIANVDPHSVRETLVHLDLTKLDLEADARFRVRDLVTELEFDWGHDTYVRLDAFTQPVHILWVLPPAPPERKVAR